MTPPRARPRFSLEDPRSPDEVVTRLASYLARHPGAVTGKVFRRSIVLSFADAHRHFWSPQLDVQVDDDASGGARVDGRLAPQPRVWTMFVAIQLLFGCLSLAAAIYLYSQWTVGGDLVVPAIVLVLMLIGGGLSYGAAYVGQGISSEQMYELRAYLDAALREPPEGDPAAAAEAAEG